MYFKNFLCFKEIHSTVRLCKHHTGRRGNHKIILEDFERNYCHQMPLVMPLFSVNVSTHPAEALEPGELVGKS